MFLQISILKKKKKPGGSEKTKIIILYDLKVKQFAQADEHPT